MRWLRSLCVLGLVAAAVGVTASPAARAQSEDGGQDGGIAPYIIDGEPIPITDAPWQVSVVFPSFFGGSSCGGSVIAPNLVLTAAHCVDQVDDPFRLIVTAGSATAFDLENGQASRVASIVVHPLYESGLFSSFNHDIALLELATPLTFELGAAPIELASSAELATSVGGPAAITGWGRVTATDPDSAPEDLRGGVVVVLSDEECGALPTIGTQFEPATQVCAAASVSGTNACSGDSGGPLVIDVAGVPKQAGVVSWGPVEPPCDVSGAVFTEVPAFLDWIAMNSPAVVTSEVRTEIIGLMFDDTNGNGVRESGEPGVSGQTVTLTRFSRTDSFTPTKVVATAETDAQGKYEFSNVIPGIFDLTFELPDDRVRVAVDQGDDDSIDSDIAELGAPRTEKFLARAGAVVTGYDAGVMVPSIVTGIIFEDLDVNGINDGEPLSTRDDAPIIEVFQGNAFVDLLFVRDGSFELQLSPGTYRLEYSSLSDDGLTRANVGDDDAVDSDFDPFTLRTEEFELAFGQRQTFDVGLRPLDAGPLVVLGDANCDGAVNILDAFVVAQAAVDLRTASSCPLDDPLRQYSEASADVSGDGTVLILDAFVIAQCAVDLSDACE